MAIAPPLPQAPAQDAARASWIDSVRVPAVLLALMWLPLTGYVIGGGLGDMPDALLLPALPAALLLYAWVVRAWRSSWIAVLGATLVFAWLILAVSAPLLPLADPNAPIAPFTGMLTEKKGHLFLLGADLKGRDMLSRTIWGAQRVLVWGVTATLVAYLVGAVLGLLAGYLGGWWDEVISFVANVLLSFPIMVLYILVLNAIGASGFNIIIAVTFASAPAIMRIVRGLTMDIKTRDYVFAAQTRGESPIYIMAWELLPNVRGPVIVDACLRLGYTTVAITTLTFLGLGLQPPDPDWGLMIRESASTGLIPKFSYQLIVPALSVSTLILGFNLMADGLREISLRD
ncbi:MAG: ABC transporter permease [Burkholderiales bacterium]|nr:MAG: ABC transporter permease [Burkholderiales bacterium]